MLPLISVAMASYNGSSYIKEQIDSIMNQTYSNIELVIFDDGSTDSTIVIINEMQKKYDTIFLHYNEKNNGITKAFEYAIKKCKGSYIALSDQDDIWHKNKLTIIAKYFAEEDLYYSNTRFVNQLGVNLHQSFKELIQLKSMYNGVPFLLNNCIPGHTMVFKKDFIATIMPFPQIMLFDRWIGYCAAANKGVKYIDEILVDYRQHDNNAVGSKHSSAKNKRKRKTSKQLYFEKKEILETFLQAPNINTFTKTVLDKVLAVFSKKWSITRSILFFKYQNDLLQFKKKSNFRKNLYCLKMFFKANY